MRAQKRMPFAMRSMLMHKVIAVAGFAAREEAPLDESTQISRTAIVLGPGSGRSYPMGRISAVFKADGAETGNAYSISEWFLEPHTQGPGPHSHAEDDIFYVIEGVMSFFVGDHWIDAPRGAFVLVPGGLTHDFQNRGKVRAGLLNFSAPGGFEPEMPNISQWFIENPPGRAGD